MSKRIISVLLVLLIVCTVSACNENFPNVVVDNASTESSRQITIGKPYTYIGFDLENTDGGKDLTLHFTEDEE